MDAHSDLEIELIARDNLGDLVIDGFDLALRFGEPKVSRWGIESTIMVPGAFTRGTNHFAHSGKPADTGVVGEYENGPYAGVADQALKGLASLEPADADPEEVARQIVNVVNMPFGKRPFRVHVDPSQDGAEIVNAVADRMRREMYVAIGLQDLLSPRIDD